MFLNASSCVCVYLCIFISISNIQLADSDPVLHAHILTYMFVYPLGHTHAIVWSGGSKSGCMPFPFCLFARVDECLGCVLCVCREGRRPCKKGKSFNRYVGFVIGSCIALIHACKQGLPIDIYRLTIASIISIYTCHTHTCLQTGYCGYIHTCIHLGSSLKYMQTGYCQYIHSQMHPYYYLSIRVTLTCKQGIADTYSQMHPYRFVIQIRANRVLPIYTLTNANIINQSIYLFVSPCKQGLTICTYILTNSSI